MEIIRKWFVVSSILLLISGAQGIQAGLANEDSGSEAAEDLPASDLSPTDLLPDLFRGAPIADRVDTPEPGYLRESFAEISPGLFANHRSGQVPERLGITLSDGKHYLIERKNSYSIRNSGLVWIGLVEGRRADEAILVYRKGRLTGKITLGDAVFEIAPQTESLHVIRELDVNAVPEHSDIPDLPSASTLNAPAFGSKGTTRDTSAFIDLMVVYTDDARAIAGSVQNMEDAIDLAVAEANSGYANSGITQRLRLVHTGEVAYDETSFNWNQTVDRLVGVEGAGNSLESVRTLRDIHGADLVALIVRDSSAQQCGNSYVMGDPPDSSFAPYALVAVRYQLCLVGNYSMAHELGHSMGAGHDRVHGGVAGAYDYAHGYDEPSGAFYTIMAYGDSCPEGSVCNRINYWSNPNVDFGGEPTGVDTSATDSAYNALVLNNTADIVANFRQHVGDDNYEENDSLATAHDIQNDEQSWLSAINGMGIQIDEDWYKIFATPDYQRFRINLNFSHAAGNLDLELIDSAGASVTSSTSLTDNEEIAVEVPWAGVHYIKVTGDNTANEYDLWWDDIPTDDDFYEANNTATSAYDLSEHADTYLSEIHGEGIYRDADWYRIRVEPGYEIVQSRLTYSPGLSDFSLNLYDQDGTTLLISSSPVVLGIESLTYQVAAPGDYYLKVGANTTVGSSYNMKWNSQPVDAPDLVVASVSIDDNTLQNGDNYTLSATVGNQGALLSPASTVSFYLSENSTISEFDTALGSMNVSSLSAGSEQIRVFPGTLSAPTGIYYMGACVASVSGEYPTWNNCSDSVQILVSEPTSQCAAQAVVVNSGTEYSGTSTVCSAVSISTNGTVSVPSGATVTYDAPLIMLEPGFSAQGNFTAKDLP